MTPVTTNTAELTRPTWHHFVSPHYDDIALSCGGSAALLARACRSPEVTIVFGGEPDPEAPLSSFAAQMHRGWGLDDRSVIASRRQEEQTAAAVLGTTIHALPFRDAIYRGQTYRSDDDLFAPPPATEADIPSRVLTALRDELPASASARIYAPLGVGGHVDHRYAFDAAVAFATAGWDVWFYEEMPYALRRHAVEERLASVGLPLSIVAQIDISDTWETKLAAMLAYESQLPTIFGWVGSDGSAREIQRMLLDYSRKLGSAAYVERYWILS